MGAIRAKLFKNGSSQAVRLPKAFRFSGTEVTLTRDIATGSVTISPVIGDSWEEFFAFRDAEPSLKNETFERVGNDPIEIRDLF